MPTSQEVIRPMWIYPRFSDRGSNVLARRSVLLYSPSDCLSEAPIPPSRRPQFTPKFLLFFRKKSLAIRNQPAIIMRPFVTATCEIATKIGAKSTLDLWRAIDHIGALENTTDRKLLMWQTIKRWLRGLLEQIPKPLRSYLRNILIGSVVFGIFYLSVRGVGYVNERWPSPTGTNLLKFAEQFLGTTGLILFIVFIILSTLRCLNELFVDYLGVDIIKAIKKRLGFDESDDQPHIQPPGPPTQPSEQPEEGQSIDVPEDQAKSCPKNQSKKKPKSKRKKKAKKTPRK